MNMPENAGEVIDIASQTEAPIGNWLLSAVNDNGLALILAVSMSLVIGGDHISHARLAGAASPMPSCSVSLVSSC